MTHHASGTEGERLRIGIVDPGDIIFVSDDSKRPIRMASRFFNVKGQRVLAATRRTHPLALSIRTPQYSHVLLGIGGGLAIHADGKTVAVDIVSDVLQPHEAKALKFQVYRRRGLPAEVAARIVREAKRYFRQKYRFWSYFAGAERSTSHQEDATQFCSRLLAHSYRSVGVRLSSLPDHKILPVDIYMACQSAPWQDVTKDLLERELPPGIDDLIGPIDLPGLGMMRPSEFWSDSERTLREAVENQKKIIELEYKTQIDAFRTQALIAKYNSALLDRAKAVMIDPSLADDEHAQSVARVLAQMPALLDLSQLPSLDLIIQGRSTDRADARSALPAYAGLPSSQDVYRLEVSGEYIRLLSYFIMGEFGLATILSKMTDLDVFARFRTSNENHAERYLGALEMVDELSPYEREVEHGFLWATNEGDRLICRKSLDTILKCLTLIRMLLAASSDARPPSSPPRRP